MMKQFVNSAFLIIRTPEMIRIALSFYAAHDQEPVNSPEIIREIRSNEAKNPDNE